MDTHADSNDARTAATDDADANDSGRVQGPPDVESEAPGTVEHFTFSRSARFAEFADALSKAQGEIVGASKDSLNPHFKNRYADLAAVWDACREPLSKHGIAVIQPPCAKGATVTVTTLLAHKSGEWIRADLTMTAQQNTPQGIGSCITYARRYALQSMVGIAPEDDDGNAASGNGNGQAQRPAPAPKVDDGPPVPPNGYGDWKADLAAVVDEGTARLQETWQASKPEYRRHMANYESATWEKFKAKAAKVKTSEAA